ncbi:hypothetical protein PACTADRAFT_34123 [Pachysolen tannophilus NRRL Y-2460]|uniref:NAD-dependent epimerase/dehydratase domain-containing protein n=1 Tax=Pachysolen tannophilus NRRL Y-2460 TaxID=669874 RepID=A0A1E4TV09_PACTA|nr:hypothetical protein PACTADRAFT_34123 [Pachysolen tannophilus NRRL Y-2460]
MVLKVAFRVVSEVSEVNISKFCFFRNSRRYISLFPLKSDVNITGAGKIVTAVGQGNRSSRTGYTATVFGGSGFLGRQLVAKLAKHGTITVVPFRNAMLKRQLKVNGDLGVVNFMEFDIRNLDSIAKSVAHSDIVFNLIGSEHWTKNFSMADVNIEAARRIAKASREAGVPRFIHVSSYNANPNSESIFYATKGLSEQVVKDFYPDATIVRPAPMYGRNSRFLNELLRIKVLGGNIIFKKEVYPVHGAQVAQALEKIGYDDSTMGQTFELYGNERYSKAELREMIKHIIHIDQRGYYPASAGYYLPIPEFLVKFVAQVRQVLSSQERFNTDQLTRVHINQVIDPNCKTFNDLDMVADELSEYLYRYVKPVIFHSSQTENRTVYSKEEVEKLRDYVNTPKDSLNLFNI